MFLSQKGGLWDHIEIKEIKRVPSKDTLERLRTLNSKPFQLELSDIRLGFIRFRV